MMNNCLKEPVYFHREYKNDLPAQEPKNESASQAMRVVKVALPFVALYQPLGKVLAGGLGVTRTFSNMGECLSANDYGQLSWAVLNTGLAAVSVVGTIFLHPVGMLISTLQDMGLNAYQIYSALSGGELGEAGKKSMRLANNTFYLTMMIVGSVQLQLASLAIQVIVEGCDSYEEFNKGNILEMVGHIGMCMVRANQSYAQFAALQNRQVVDQGLLRKATASAAKKVSTLEAAMDKLGSWRPELKQLVEQHKGEFIYAEMINHPDVIDSLSDDFVVDLCRIDVKPAGESGDLVAVWLNPAAKPANQWEISDLDHSLNLSHYNASTGIWSAPASHSIGKLPEDDYSWSLMSVDSIGNALVLLQNRTLDSLAFDCTSGWTNPVRLADFIPEKVSFDSDELGNCTMAWFDEQYALTSRSYEAQAKSWDQAVTFGLDPAFLGHGTIYSHNLIVRRDEDKNIAILAGLANFEEEAAYASMFNAKTGTWANKKVPVFSDGGVVDFISLGKGQFMGISASEHSIASVQLDVAHVDANLSLKPIKTSKGDVEGIVLEKDASGNPVIAWTEGDFENWMEFCPAKIFAAHYNAAKNSWESKEVAQGNIFVDLKFGKAKDDLYLFWEEFLMPDDEYFPINLHGVKWEKNKWKDLGVLNKSPMKMSFFDGDFFISHSMKEEGLHLTWKDGDDFLKQTISL